MEKLYQILDQLNISYEKLEHQPVFTAEEAEKVCAELKGVKNKSLFLRNKKGDTHYLVVIESNKQADIKKLEQLLNESRLSFASPDRLKKYLNLIPGSVSSFGLINDQNHEVKVIVDQDLLNDEFIQLHPNINTATLVISTSDYQKFLKWTGNKITYLNL